MKVATIDCLTWLEVAKHKPLFLNFGGRHCCHPKKGYINYVSVDLRPVPEAEWSVRHDLKKPVPLPDNSVDRIHAEDFLEHLTIENVGKILRESYRLLKIEGRMRIGAPDYNNPKDQPYLKKGHDPRHPHKTLTHYELMKKIVEESPFPKYKFYHYWKDGKFIREKIDYSLGMIQRTPDNDKRCTPQRPLYVTSLVLDLFKLG